MYWKLLKGGLSYSSLGVEMLFNVLVDSCQLLLREGRFSSRGQKIMFNNQCVIQVKLTFGG